MALVNRLLAALLQLVIIIDELAQWVLRTPIYLCTGYNVPSAHETISAWVGSSAAAGQGWAIEAQRLIDGIFSAGHCARAAAFEKSVDTPA